MPIYANIAGAQREVKDWYCNINGASKKFNSFLGNINGAAVELLVKERRYYSFDYESSGILPTNTRKRMVADEITISSDGTITLLNPTSISGRPAANKFFVSISTSSNSSATTGTTVYYSTNSSGSYRAFNPGENVFIISSASGVVSTTIFEDMPDVFVSGTTLYVLKDLLPKWYRYKQANVTYQQSKLTTTSEFEVADMESGRAGTDYTVEFNNSFGYYYTVTGDSSVEVGKWFVQTHLSQYPTTVYRISRLHMGMVYTDAYRDVTTKKSTDTGKYGVCLTTRRFGTGSTGGFFNGFWYYSPTVITM